MDIHRQENGDVTVVKIVGDIDSGSAQAVQARIMEAVEPNCKLVLDMSEVGFMSSAGLRVVLVLYREINEALGDVVLANVAPAIQDVMEVTGFLEHFRISDSIEEGVRQLQNGRLSH